MAVSSSKFRAYMKTSAVVADAASLCLAVGLIGLILITTAASTNGEEAAVRGMAQSSSLVEKPCDDIYVVGDGETLHTISDKCGDPYIVERNPHIHDPDDVFPGLVIEIVPLNALLLTH